MRRRKVCQFYERVVSLAPESSFRGLEHIKEVAGKAHHVIAGGLVV
jgi:hypothetical protein